MTTATGRRSRSRALRLLLGAAAATTSVAATTIATTDVSAHGTNDTVHVVSPINGAATWNRFGAASPASHHIVYANGAYMNDISVDIHAAAGSPIVTPFGSRTNTGHTVESKIIRVKAGCASGAVSHGGYRVTVQARDTTTGVVLGYADIMHVNSPLGVGTVLGPWTVLGRTAQWAYSSCYQVTNPNGVHVHLELQNAHRYACMNNLAAGISLTGSTRIGLVGSHNYTRQRSYC